MKYPGDPSEPRRACQLPAEARQFRSVAVQLLATYLAGESGQSRSLDHRATRKRVADHLRFAVHKAVRQVVDLERESGRCCCCHPVLDRNLVVRPVRGQRRKVRITSEFIGETVHVQLTRHL